MLQKSALIGRNQSNGDLEDQYDIIVVGSGMAGLTSAALLANRGLKVAVLEQNWIPGGCTTSYPRKKFVFEAGATTLVGLDEGMPLRYLLDQLGVELEVLRLDLPMQVWLNNGTVLNRYENLEDWIREASSKFEGSGQAAFWKECFAISEFVWKSSLRQLAFPPTSIKDLFHSAKNASLGQVRHLPHAFRSTEQLLRKHKLDKDSAFCEFIDEQLLITAQNFAPEVNQLFGGAALCYTNYGNYYVPGGMRNLVQPLADYIKAHQGKVLLRHLVEGVERGPKGYRVQTRKHGSFQAPLFLSALPLNNTFDLFPEAQTRAKSRPLMASDQLRSAWQMGIACKKIRDFEAIHHQIHLSEPLAELETGSIFLSMSHPEDRSRCAEDETVFSISTHVFDPARTLLARKAEIEEAVVKVLEEKGFLRREDILYQHSSTPGGWEKWTRRAWGFVGGYPQYMKVKPWQMKDARLDGKGAYICGDSTYPGQGIPGACLSGIIAVEKMAIDGRI